MDSRSENVHAAPAHPYARTDGHVGNNATTAQAIWAADE